LVDIMLKGKKLYRLYREERLKAWRLQAGARHPGPDGDPAVPRPAPVARLHDGHVDEADDASVS
jgi:hypothetical protein